VENHILLIIEILALFINGSADDGSEPENFAYLVVL